MAKDIKMIFKRFEEIIPKHINNTSKNRKKLASEIEKTASIPVKIMLAPNDVPCHKTTYHGRCGSRGCGSGGGC